MVSSFFAGEGKTVSGVNSLSNSFIPVNCAQKKCW